MAITPGYAQRLVQDATTPYAKKLIEQVVQQPAPPAADPAPAPPADSVLSAIQSAVDALAAAKTGMDTLATGLGGQDADFAKALASLRKARSVAMPVVLDSGGSNFKGKGKSLGSLWGGATASTASGMAKRAANEGSSCALQGQLAGVIHTIEQMRQDALAQHDSELAQAFANAANEVRWGGQWQSQVTTRLNAVRTEARGADGVYADGGEYAGAIARDKPGKNVSKFGPLFIKRLDVVEPKISAASYESHVTANCQGLAGGRLGQAGYWLQQAVIARYKTNPQAVAPPPPAPPDAPPAA